MKVASRLTLLLLSTLGLSGCQLVGNALNTALRLWPYLLVENESCSPLTDIKSRAVRIQNAPAYEGCCVTTRRISVETIANR